MLHKKMAEHKAEMEKIKAQLESKTAKTTNSNRKQMLRKARMKELGLDKATKVTIANKVRYVFNCPIKGCTTTDYNLNFHLRESSIHKKEGIAKEDVTEYTTFIRCNQQYEEKQTKQTYKKPTFCADCTSW